MSKEVETETHKEPQTKEDWQEAVNSAHYCLCLDAAVQYGLIKHVPVNEDGTVTKDWWYRDSGVNVSRCQEIIERGAFMGIYPKEEKITNG